MKQFMCPFFQWGSLLLLISILSCNMDEQRRLQVDQSYEGEEIYLISRVLDEHVLLAFIPYEKYRDTLFTATLADCPEVSLKEDKKEVHLEYLLSNCDGVPAVRTGKIILAFEPSPLSQNETIRLSYENYSVYAVNIRGSRTFNLISNGRTRQLFSDMAEDLVIENEVGSTSKVSFSFEHELTLADKVITEYVSTGSLTGRNWTGKTISMDIAQGKLMTKICWDQKKFRPISGEERWTVERTEVPDVTHRLTYQHDGDCETRSLIILAEGVHMEKRP